MPGRLIDARLRAAVAGLTIALAVAPASPTLRLSTRRLRRRIRRTAGSASWSSAARLRFTFGGRSDRVQPSGTSAEPARSLATMLLPISTCATGGVAWNPSQRDRRCRLRQRLHRLSRVGQFAMSVRKEPVRTSPAVDSAAGTLIPAGFKRADQARACMHMSMSERPALRRRHVHRRAVRTRHRRPRHQPYIQPRRGHRLSTGQSRAPLPPTADGSDKVVLGGASTRSTGSSSSAHRRRSAPPPAPRSRGHGTARWRSGTHRRSTSSP